MVRFRDDLISGARGARVEPKTTLRRITTVPSRPPSVTARVEYVPVCTYAVDPDSWVLGLPLDLSVTEETGAISCN